MTRQGLLLLDANCYSRLIDAATMRQLKANMRAAWLDPAPSEVNLLELSETPSPAVEGALIAALREFAGDWPLLEWPFALLKRLAQALIDDATAIRTGESGKEWYLEDSVARAKLRSEIAQFNDTLERAFSDLHAKTRSKTQRWLKSSGAKPSLDELSSFLDDEWPTLELRDHVLGLTWESFGLPGDAPIQRLLGIPAWQLLSDIEGAALFVRALVHEQGRRVHRADLIQLIYLGASGIRLLASSDEPFLAMARQIINGRYAGARVLHIDEFLNE
jgi:hypothetical protein